MMSTTRLVIAPCPFSLASFFYVNRSIETTLLHINYEQFCAKVDLK